MSLDITLTRRKKFICPKCGEVVGSVELQSVSSGGTAWYPFLEEIGYYAPYAQVGGAKDWYGKDMTLTSEQAHYVYTFAQEEDVYNWHEIVGLIAVALVEKDDIVVNADW